ncbi:MAG: hypothetical protein AAF480_07690 [Actinomycetota bacterium]
MPYAHTQTSPAMPVGPALVLVGLATTIAVIPRAVVVVPTIGFAIVLSVIFIVAGRLTVTVGDGQVRAAGWGLPRWTIRTDTIAAARQVRNRWYHGWGIRLIPRGVMFNTWGLDAVELELRSGRRFRIGTDEPAALLDAVEAEAGRA